MFLTAVLRLAVATWRRHYRVPECAYWIGLLIGVGAAFAGLLTDVYGDLFSREAFGRPFVGGLAIAAVNVVVLAVCVTGIVRWYRDRRKARGGLVVALFYETAGAKDRGRDVQLMVLDALQQHVPDAQRSQVHGVKASVDLEHRDFAVRLLRRLRAAAVLHGRVVDRADGGWTVHARLALLSTSRLTHYDWHTNDTTPGRMPWTPLFSKLPSTHGVTDEEFPLELTRDLEALMHGTLGAVGIADSPAEIESLLSGALAVKPDAASPAMDVLRTQLALAIFFQDERQDEALEVLRERIKAGDAFGELLRGFAFLAYLRRQQVQAEIRDDYGEGDLPPDSEPDDDELDDDEDDLTEDFTEEQRELYDRAQALERESEELYARAYMLADPEDGFETYDGHIARLREQDASLRGEIIAALESASADQRDPRRDMSLYNLVGALLAAAAEEDQLEEARGAEVREAAWKRLDELHARSAYYRKAWYVKRLLGLRAWLKFEAIAAQHRAHSSEGIEAAKEASKWYSRAIRARPRLGVVRFVGFPIWRRYRIRSRRSLILDGNARDAHFFAGQRLRTIHHELRFVRRRRALLRGAYRDLRRGYLDLAYGQLDWIEVGRHRPELERHDAVEATALAARDRVCELMMAESHAEHPPWAGRHPS